MDLYLLTYIFLQLASAIIIYKGYVDFRKIITNKSTELKLKFRLLLIPIILIIAGLYYFTRHIFDLIEKY